MSRKTEPPSDTANPAHAAARLRRRRRWTAWLAGALLLGGVLLWLLPLGIEALLEAQLRKRIADRAEIVDVDLNLFTGRLRVSGLASLQAGNELLETGELGVAVSWRALFSGELRLLAVTLERAALRVELLDDGRFRIGKLRLPATGTESVPDAAPGETAGWPFAVDRLLIDDVAIELVGARGSDLLEIRHAELRGLASRHPETTVLLRADALLNGAPVRLDLDVTPLAEQPTLVGSMRVDGLELAELQLLRALPGTYFSDLAARLELDNRITLALGPVSRAYLSGPINIGGLRYAAAGVQTSLAGFAWDGELQAHWSEAGRALRVTGRGALDAPRHQDPGRQVGVQAAGATWDGAFGLAQSAGVPAAATWSGELAADAAAWRLPGSGIVLERLAWSGAFDLEQGSAGTLLEARSGHLDIDGLTVEAAHGRLAGKRLAWSGSASARRGPQPDELHLATRAARAELHGIDFADAARRIGLERLEGTVLSDLHMTADGVTAGLELALQGAGLELADTSRDFSLQLDGIDWESGTAEASFVAGGIRLRHPGTLALTGLAVDGPFGHLRQAGRMAWEGRLEFDRPTGAPLALRTDGLLALPAMTLDLVAPAARIAFRGLDWRGRADAADVAAGVAVTGNLGVAGFVLSLPEVGVRELSSERMEVRGIAAGWPGTQGLAGGSLHGLRLRTGHAGAVERPALLEAVSVEFEQLQRGADGRVELESVLFTDLVTTLLRDADGSLRLPGSAAGSAGPAVDAEPARETPSAAAPDWRIGRLEIGGESRAVFEDRSVDPVLRTEMRIEQFVAERLASGSGSAPGSLRIAGRFGEYSRFELRGTLHPDPGQLRADLAGSLTEFDLPPLSPYTEAHLGHALHSGQFSADLELVIADGALSGEQVLRINQVTVEPIASPALEAFTAQVGMSLDSALSMLRDKQNNIRITVPVMGPLDDPQFDLSDALRQALGKATRTALLGVLSVALQPYGAMLMAAKLVGDAHANVALEPLPFAPGSAADDLLPADYLERLTALLSERPGIQLRICGSAVAADRLALEQARAAELQAARAAAAQRAAAGDAAARPAESAAPPPPIADALLLELARSRAEQVKRWLAGTERVASERLFVCLPRIDAEQGAAPRVDLLL